MDTNKRQSVLSWSLMLALVVFCSVLGVLQYRWIDQVSIAANERLRGNLQSSLNQLSRDFDAQITSACQRLVPQDSVPNAAAAEADVSLRLLRGKATGLDTRMFRAVALAEPEENGLVLRILNFENGAFQTAEWPPDWTAVRERLESRLPPGVRAHHGPMGDSRSRIRSADLESPVFESPLWGPQQDSPFDRRETAWLIFHLDMSYMRDTLLPAVIQRRLGSGGELEYQIEVVDRSGSVVYRSDAGDAQGVRKNDLTKYPDASVALFQAGSGPLMHGDPGRPPGPSPVGGRGPVREPGRWQMYVRNRAGSLDVVVARARWLNTLVTSGILLLLIATVAALIRFTRRAQKLAELQMEFVANVSHELRTPITVIHTAAYNLQGAAANRPEQVGRYGAVIQRESGRLKELVEQVLQFASANAGRAIREREAVSLSQVIADAAQSVQSVVEQEGCVLHQNVEPALPMVLGDRAALKQAIQNLLSDAAKYGSSGSKWIGIAASKSRERDREVVEIRVLDRGQGIPGDERDHIFEPFFRGRWAVRNQVHGTGLGLNLVKRVVEAHHGSIEVKSEASEGTEFIVRLPTMVPEQAHAHSFN